MKKNSRIRFNPVTKEIEIEGSEKFVKAYFNKLQAMIPGTTETKTKESKPVKAAPVKTRKRKSKAEKAIKKEPGEKRITHIASVVSLVHASTEGISTAELKEKTGLAERQIWSIVNRAAKLGKIKKMKRGLYGAVSASRE